MPLVQPHSATGDGLAAVSIVENRPHECNLPSIGFVDEDYWAMVHTPIPMPKAMRIPEAKAAVDKEWDNLYQKGAWFSSFW